MHDLAIVGGGPVGLMAALYAVRAGLSCVVLEQRAGVIDKACGEGIMPAGVAALDDLGVVAHGISFAGIRYVRGSRSAVAEFSTPGRGIRRTVLHESLLHAVRSRGVEVRQVQVAAVVSGDDQVMVQSKHTGAIAARHLIAADGLHSPIRAQLGLSAPARTGPRFAQRRHFEVTPWDRHVQVHWGDHAEAYVTPVAHNQVGVAVLTRRRGSFDSHLAEFPALREQLTGAAHSSSVRGAGPLRQRSTARVAGRVLLVGDASGYVDALTGEGIMLGAAQAAAAVSAIAARDLPAYERRWQQITRSHVILTQALLGLTRPPLGRRAVVPLSAAMPTVFTGIVRRIGA